MAGRGLTRGAAWAGLAACLIRLLAGCLLAWVVAGCTPGAADAPATARPTAGPGTAAAVALPGRETALPVPGATPQPTPTPTTSVAPTRTAAPSPLPAATHTPSPTPSPQPPPLLPATDGPGLALSLRPLTSVDTHITAGAVADLAGQPAFYFASLDRTLYAYDAAGGRRWKASMAGPVYAVAALPGGAVAAGDDSGLVRLFDPSGSPVWSHGLGTRVTALSAAFSEGLLAGGWDERLTLLAVAPGAERVQWQVPLGSPVTGLAALPGVALASTMGGDVWAFSPGGAPLWRFGTGAPVTRLSAGLVQEATGGPGIVLAGVQDGRLVALSSGGEQRWQVDLGEGSPVWHLARLREGDPPIVLAATGGATPTLSLLSAAGEWLWRLALPAPAGAVAALDPDSDGSAEIVAGLADGRVVVYDRDGRRRAALQAGLPVWDLVPGGARPAAGGLLLADLNAWQIGPGAGAAVEPRLRVPPLVPAGAVPLPPAAIRMASTDPPRDGAVLAFLGDVVPGRSIELQAQRFGASYPWTGLAPLLHDADLAMANLESVLSTRGTALKKRYVIRAHPETVQTLLAGGLDLVGLANNHTLDYGDAAHDDTLAALERAGIVAVGAGRTAAEARRAARFDLNGVRVALLAYAGDYWQGSADMPVSDRIAWSSSEAVAEEVRAERKEADVVVVILHAGKEYARTPSETQVRVAHAAIDAGAGLVVGHHPHVTQTVERYGGGLIVYSLGNALFDIPLQSAMQGDLLRVQVTREGLARAELWPFWIEAGIRPLLIRGAEGLPQVNQIYP